ncbi:tripartite tricarboxylate transporter substrate binding protein [Pseudarthrobacter raffinosi]|uniref:tripartite tricarboxylate transporter substrate binding protein n=1 Tax=Pseudarthrobacter raffinosi TaxID=2953651 RepID=UPI00208E2B02|nr:tripartite tricarboxylate transporter substrate binding protein [Pseudarthrobacter sp. MDT3-9]MCO4252082.1 tripartite tricarboxylate transporter substrate binding protein [Pseudarthrobacter sp. MDT3-9]
MKKRLIPSLAALVLTALAAAGCSTPSTQGSGGAGADFPKSPVKIVVPFGAGGGSDAVARQMASQLEKELGGTFIVDNKPGAAGVLGTDGVSKAKADGYTLLSTNSFAFTAQQKLRKTSYTSADFKPIAEETSYGLVQVVRADSPWNSVKDMLDADKLTYAHPGVGGMVQLAEAALFDAGGTDAQGVPFDGSAPSVTALLGGQVDTTAAEVGVALPYIKSGQLKALSVTTPERVKQLPDVPTVEEAGYPQASITASEVLLAPAGIPDDVAKLLEGAAKKAVASTEFTSFLENSVYKAGVTSGAELDKQIADATTTVTGMIERLNIKIEG